MVTQVGGVEPLFNILVLLFKLSSEPSISVSLYDPFTCFPASLSSLPPLRLTPDCGLNPQGLSLLILLPFLFTFNLLFFLKGS